MTTIEIITLPFLLVVGLLLFVVGLAAIPVAVGALLDMTHRLFTGSPSGIFGPVAQEIAPSTTKTKQIKQASIFQSERLPSLKELPGGSSCSSIKPLAVVGSTRRYFAKDGEI